MIDNPDSPVCSITEHVVDTPRLTSEFWADYVKASYLFDYETLGTLEREYFKRHPAELAAMTWTKR